MKNKELFKPRLAFCHSQFLLCEDAELEMNLVLNCVKYKEVGELKGPLETAAA